MMEQSGSFEYSGIIRVVPGKESKPILVGQINPGNISLIFNKPFAAMAIYNSNGNRLASETGNGLTGRYRLKLNLVHGIYFIRAVGMDQTRVTLKFVY
jgi:hypothetical protein